MRRAPGSLFGMLALLGVLWGTAFVLIKDLLEQVSPTSLTVLRFAAACACLGIVCVARPGARPRLAPGHAWRYAVLAVTGVPGYHLALNWGERRTSASAAALVVATAPVMTAILSAAVLRERVGVRLLGGMTLAFGGVALLALTSEQSSGRETLVSGVLVALLAPVSWAVYSVVAKPLVAADPPERVTVTTMLLGAATLIPFVPTTVGDALDLGASGWLAVAALGAGSSVGGYFIFVWALSRMSATRLSVFLYAVPVVALLASWAILGEPLGPAVAVAAALVVAGVSLALSETRAPTARASAPRRVRV